MPLSLIDAALLSSLLITLLMPLDFSHDIEH